MQKRSQNIGPERTLNNIKELKKLIKAKEGKGEECAYKDIKNNGTVNVFLSYLIMFVR